jgi:hypothetical protein
MPNCNEAPELISAFDHSHFESEMMNYLYFPIFIRSLGMKDISIEPRMRRYRKMIECAMEHDRSLRDRQTDYVYLTAKTVVVGPTVSGNRPGWHCDGYGTDDTNYIWCDSSPTIYNKCNKFNDISEEHATALKQLQKIAEENSDDIYDLGTNALVLLTDKVVHHTPKVWIPGVRSFVKISFSDLQFNLKGNSRNYALDYDWALHDREVTLRNTEMKP